MIYIIHHAVIHTLNPAQPIATAIAFDNHRILMVGLDSEVTSEFGRRSSSIRDIHAGGRAIIPGLTDAHFHLQHYALGLTKVDCETATRSDCIQRVAERAAKLRAGEWILGHGWNQNNWSDGFGSAGDLDAVTPDNPVFLTAKSLHSSWVNSAALRLAGINAQTPDPPRGQIGRDVNGFPNGILFEGASQLMESTIPEPDPEEILQAIRVTLSQLARMGITGLHDFDRKKCFQALQTLHGQGELSLRVVKSIPIEDLSHALAVGLQSGFGDEFLRIGGVKVFADGALGPRTAAMIQPYEGETENRGILFLDGEEIFEYGRQAAEGGLAMAVHAIGDRANHEALEAFSQLRSYERQHPLRSDLRHRIEHVQVIHPDDSGRLAELGVVASMQPIHATSDMLMADRHWGNRSAYAYAWRRQLNAGGVLAFGSDAPVESPNPFLGLHAAVTRRRADGSPGPHGWFPDQKITIDEAVHGFTTGPAFTAYLDDRLGMLAPGFLADLLFLTKDPYTCDPSEIKEIRPVATIIGGNWVFSEID